MTEDFRERYARFLAEFGPGRTMVLSTAQEGQVSSRMMSVVQQDGVFYFQTDKTFRKYGQLLQNPRVALCIDNIQIEGRCEEIGHPLEAPFFCSLYQTCFPGSYRKYSALQNERLFAVRPTAVERWLYRDGDPFLERFDLEQQAYHCLPYRGE